MKITTDFDKLSFHDAGINRIARSEGSISICVSGVYISREHPQSHGKNWLVESGTLVLLGVTGEEAKYWDDTKAPKPHPEPDVPLDEIMHATFERGIFHFDGFKNTVSWYEWFVTAKGFSLDVAGTIEQNS